MKYWNLKYWNRKLWGIALRGRDGREMLIGSIWHTHAPTPYDGEPAHAFLFTTREQARAWCLQEQRNNVGRNDYCADWRFRPVRVREVVKVCSPPKRLPVLRRNPSK